MAPDPEMIADLRDIIACDASAQVVLNYKGRIIFGTKGNLAASGTYDRDGGGINYDDSWPATFVACDFPVKPDGTENVTVDGAPWRIARANYDDFNVACVIDFVSVSAI
jgi:hypothetical protein